MWRRERTSSAQGCRTAKLPFSKSNDSALPMRCSELHHVRHALNIWWKISSLAFRAIASQFPRRQMCSRRKFSFAERAFHIDGRVYKRRRWLDLTANRSQIKGSTLGRAGQVSIDTTWPKNKNLIKLIWTGLGSGGTENACNFTFSRIATESGCFFFPSCAHRAHHHHRRLATCCFVEW